MLCTNQGHCRTVMKPLLQNTAGQQISTVQPLLILAKYHNTDAPIHSLYKQHGYVCGCCQSDSVLSRTGAQGGVLVWLTVMMSQLWAQPANQGLLQRRTENYSPFPHSISSLSLSLSAYSSLYLLSHLSFLNTPTLLPFSIPFFLSPIPLSFSHTGNMHQLGRKISAGTETITELNSALCGSAQHNKANTAKSQTCRSTVKLNK